MFVLATKQRMTIPITGIILIVIAAKGGIEGKAMVIAPSIIKNIVPGVRIEQIMRNV